jgi:hypothetical protein
MRVPITISRAAVNATGTASPATGHHAVEASAVGWVTGMRASG